MGGLFLGRGGGRLITKYIRAPPGLPVAYNVLFTYTIYRE